MEAQQRRFSPLKRAKSPQMGQGGWAEIFVCSLDSLDLGV
jgi:hypothetical protein